MKSTLLFILLLTSISIAQNTEWKILNPFPVGNNNLTSVHMFDSLNIIAGGSGCTIIRSSDGGNNWRNVLANDNNGYTIKQFVFNNEYGLALTSGTDIFKSIDEGNSWNKLYNQEDKEFSSISLVGNKVWLIQKDKYDTKKDELLLSNDQGLNWSVKTVPDSLIKLNFVYFLNDSIGWLNGTYYRSYYLQNCLYKTSNSGVTWEKKLVHNYSENYQMSFLNENIGWISSIGSNSYLKTTDGGENWINKGMGDFYFDSKKLKFITEKQIVAVGNYGRICESFDRGNSWYMKYDLQIDDSRISAAGRWDCLTDFDFYGKIGLVVGNFGTLIKTIDGGLTWKLFSNRLYDNFSSIFFTDLKTGWASSTNNNKYPDTSAIFKTIDGGFSWKIQKYLSSGEIRKIFFTDANTGFGIGKNIYKTTNGVFDWLLLDELPEYFHSINFINNDEGWIGGTNGAIYKTTDAGISWIKQSVPTNLSILSLAFQNNQDGWAAGEYGTLYKTTDSGFNWVKQQSPTDYSISTILFIDDNTGFIASDKIYKTINNGNEWIEVLSTNGYLNTLGFINSSIGYAAGLYGDIYKTTDTGSTWIEQNSPTQERIWSSFFLDGIGWMAGNLGTIISATNTETHINVSNGLPGEYRLFQNYPNPFNPTTTISYSIPVRSRVELKVFDILGKEVATLVNEEKQAGKYEVNFDAASLPSGVYMYRIKASEYTSSKKLILVK